MNVSSYFIWVPFLRYDEIVERRIDLGTVLKRARLAVAASSSRATTSTSPRSSTMEGGKDSSPRSNSKGVKTRPVQSKKNNAKEGSTFSRSFSSDRGAATAGEEASEEALEPYKSCVELVEDCRVTFHNCVVYNAEGSAIVRMAKYLDKVHGEDEIVILFASLVDSYPTELFVLARPLHQRVLLPSPSFCTSPLHACVDINTSCYLSSY